MKIGIMTFCTAKEYNYGQVLQFYALQKYLRDQGHEVFFIRYDRTLGYEKGNPFWLKAIRALNPYIFVRHFYLKHKMSLFKKDNEANPRYFEEFLDKYTKESSEEYHFLDDLRKNPPEADVYITGSDQVWNADILRYDTERISAFFLDFGSCDIPRIAYAASWGQDVFPEEYLEQVRPLLKKFKSVSVREKGGINLCCKAGFENAKWVCDPTLLLTADDYRKIYNENPIRKRDKKYLFMYAIGNKKDSILDAVLDFAKRKELEVVYVPSFLSIKNAVKVYPTLPEWLYLIDNAEYVVTRSFHGTVFSTIFGKQYGTIPLTKRVVGRNARIDSLFEMCNIEPRWLNKEDDLSLLDKPYTVDISAFRQQSMNFLEEALKKSIGGGAKRLIGFALHSKKQRKPTYLTRNRLLFIQSGSPSFLNREEA